MSPVPECNTHFQDILQGVPQLLSSCISEGIEIKVLRLACKTASTLAVQAVRSYCIKLSPESSKTEPAQDVARLLQLTRLHHLRVDISVPDTVVSRYYGVPPAPPPPPHELTSQLAELAVFLSVMGTALRSVTSVEITLSRCKRMRSRQYSAPQWSSQTFSEFSVEAGSQLAALLTDACPAVTRLGMNGGLGDCAMGLFGTQWPELTTLDILEGSMWVKLFGKVEREFLFPGVTRMRMVDTQRCSDDFRELARCPSLTHLEVGDGWLEDDESGWILLPPNLQMLRCGPVPQPMPPLLHLHHLKTIHITDSRADSIDVEILASLLRAAPVLELLVTLHGVRSTILIRSCAPSVLSDLQLVRQRISTGFRMEGVEALKSDWDRLPPARPFNGRHAPTGGVRRPLPNALDLGRPPRASSFDACYFQPRTEEGRRADCLAMVALCFPDLNSLELGPLIEATWQDASLNEPLQFVFPNVRSLSSRDELPPGFALLQLVACMPELVSLRCWGRMLGAEGEVFKGALRATQAVAAAGASANVLGDWTLKSPLSWAAEWTRIIVEDGPRV